MQKQTPTSTPANKAMLVDGAASIDVFEVVELFSTPSCVVCSLALRSVIDILVSTDVDDCWNDVVAEELTDSLFGTNGCEIVDD